MVREYRYLKRVKMPVDRLQLGMYVAELDKPWKESGFLLQGFPIDEEPILRQLQKECRNVIIEFRSAQEYDNFLLQHQTNKEDSQAEEGDLPLVEELPKAIELFNDAIKQTKLVFRQSMSKKSFRLEPIENVVANIIISLERNKEALLLVANIKNKIAYDAEHAVRVAIIAIAFGQHMKFSNSQLRILGLGALFHDIGKTQVPAQILGKEDRLEQNEIVQLRQVPKHSFNILSQFESLEDAVKEIPLSLHERFDGKGYPRHLPKDRVSIRAKIVSIVSVYDALISERAHSKARTTAEAFQLINKNKGNKFDPDLVELFMKWIGIYPVGSLVEMQTGEVGIVLKNHPHKKFSPRIMLVTDESQKTGAQKVIDLEKMVVHSNGAPYEIRKGLPFKYKDILIQRYLDKKMFNVPAWCKTQETDNDSPFAKYLK